MLTMCVWMLVPMGFSIKLLIMSVLTNIVVTLSVTSVLVQTRVCALVAVGTLDMKYCRVILVWHLLKPVLVNPLLVPSSSTTLNSRPVSYVVSLTANSVSWHLAKPSSNVQNVTQPSIYIKIDVTLDVQLGLNQLSICSMNLIIFISV